MKSSAKNFVRPADKWGKYSIAQIPMGQGVAATRLQMAMAVGAIANGGVLMRPMLVKRLARPRRKCRATIRAAGVRRVISEETAKEMVEALKTVVSNDGTAPQRGDDQLCRRRQNRHGAKSRERQICSNDKFVVSFIGFFPADNPQICISIVMDSPKEGGHAFGGALCGPVFHDIAERCASYLNIPPDENLQQPNSPAIARGGYGDIHVENLQWKNAL